MRKSSPATCSRGYENADPTKAIRRTHDPHPQQCNFRAPTIRIPVSREKGIVEDRARQATAKRTAHGRSVIVLMDWVTVYEARARRGRTAESPRGRAQPRNRLCRVHPYYLARRSFQPPLARIIQVSRSSGVR